MYEIIFKLPKILKQSIAVIFISIGLANCVESIWIGVIKVWPASYFVSNIIVGLLLFLIGEIFYHFLEDGEKKELLGPIIIFTAISLFIILAVNS